MKKFLIFLMIAIFALSCFSGCNQDMGVSLDGNGVYLDYATGLNADGISITNYIRIIKWTRLAVTLA